ncbi:MAG: acetylornithine carbamoyltransferase, partial [Paludibacteraceae bacterium]|nr:acetylornithine carbamoyltransferase [Paludibacteraceae bacterium]
MRIFRDVTDLGDLHAALHEALEIKKDVYQYQHLGKNRTALLVFFNNSLRTRLSTQKAAM